MLAAFRANKPFALQMPVDPFADPLHQSYSAAVDQRTRSQVSVLKLERKPTVGSKNRRGSDDGLDRRCEARLLAQVVTSFGKAP